MSPRDRPAVRRFAALLAVVAVAGGGVGAALAGLTIHSGSEAGAGAAETATPLAWWTQETLSVATVPTGTLTAAGPNATHPSVLPTANASYRIGAATAGDPALVWEFEQRPAPVGTEFELSVTLVNASGVAGAPTTVYFETPIAPASSPVFFTIYLDLGGAQMTAVAAVAQQCAGYTSCP